MRLSLRATLRAVARDTRDEFEPGRRWAIRRMATDLSAEVLPGPPTIRELAVALAYSRCTLATYLAEFAHEDLIEERPMCMEMIPFMSGQTRKWSKTWMRRARRMRRAYEADKQVTIQSLADDFGVSYSTAHRSLTAARAEIRPPGGRLGRRLARKPLPEPDPAADDRLRAIYAELTDRPREVLQAIGTGESNKVLAARLHVRLGTVVHYMWVLRVAFEVDDRQALVTVAQALFPCPDKRSRKAASG